jgi:hypothetical protein
MGQRGLVQPGNIDLRRRPEVLNQDGTVSTVRSMSINVDGREVLIPTVVRDRVVSDEEAIREYQRTGKHLGVFDTPQNATAYAEQLHNDYAAGRLKGKPMPADPKQTEAYLRTLNTSDRARAAAFDAVHNMDDAAAQRVLAQLPFSDDVKAELWDIRAGATVSGGSAPQPANPADFTEQTVPEGSAASRLIGGAAKYLNPVTMAQGLYGAVRHPVDTYGAMVDASAQQFGKASDAAQQGRYIEAAGHVGAGTIPFVGPAAAGAGERIASGDYAGGAGEAVGILAPALVGGAARGRVAQQARAGAPATLERAAVDQVAQRVLAPGNVKFKGKAQAVAPEVLKRGMKGGRDELAQAADEGMETAGQSIDDAIAAGGGPQSGVVVDPIIRQLQNRVDDLTVNGRPIPGAEGRVAGLQGRIDYLQRVSRQRRGMARAGQPVTNPRAVSFDELRRIRDEQYRLADEVKAYQRMGNHAMSDEGFAARETGSAIRGELANLSPELAAANADYAFFKTLGDVLDPAQGRPKVSAPAAGITGGAATSGAVAGHLVGPKAAFVLSVVRPWIQKVRSEPAWQLADAQSKMRLAEAIRNGDVPTAQKLMVRIGGVGVATSPNGSRTDTAPAMP